MFVLDLDDFDQAASDFLASGKVRLVETLADLVGEIIQLVKHALQFVALGRPR